MEGVVSLIRRLDDIASVLSYGTVSIADEGITRYALADVIIRPIDVREVAHHLNRISVRDWPCPGVG